MVHNLLYVSLIQFMVHNLLYFTYHYVLEWSLNTSASIEAANRRFGSNPKFPKPIEPDKYSRFLYDAVYLFALAFNETYWNNLSFTGQNIYNASKNKIFQGQTGRFLTNNKADRQSSFLIWDMNKKNVFQQAVITRYSVNGQITWDMKAPILWGNGKQYNDSNSSSDFIPLDSPRCGFNSELCVPDNLVEVVAPPIVVSIMLAAIIIFLIIYRWWKKERELYETMWKVKYTDLNFNIARGPISQTAISTLGSKQSLNESDNRSEYSTGNVSGYSNMRTDNMLMISQMFTLVARLNGDQVAVKKVRKKSIREDKLLLKEMKIMKSLKHTNLATFHGACTEAPNICVLWEYCSKGSLEDILHNTDIKLESMFQFSIALDICTGLNYLHTSELGQHGHLKTSNCVVDSRWVAKLTDFGLQRFKKGEKPAEDTSNDKYYTDLFWTAPEVLRCILNNMKHLETKEADIYSLGIVLKQLLCKNTAYSEELNTMTAKEIILQVANCNKDSILLRPFINSEFPEHQAVMMSFVSLIRCCWSENPTERPTVKRVLNTMKRLSPLKMTGVLDNMLALMERYSTRLEDLVSERTIQLEEEKRKTETLLYRMLPRKVADDLKAGQHVQAEAFQDVTIYFSDIVGFTTLAGESTPMEIVEMLNLLYSQFDNIIQNFNVYKVETIGDAYMTVCGCPEPNSEHAPVMADMSLALLDSVIHFVIPHRPNNQLRIRIGLNSGPVVAGVVGNTMPRYCLFGNTVNLASRMESQGMPQCIQISYFTYELLKKYPDFIMVPRGLVEIKGKGKMPTYWLKGRCSTMQLHLETDDISRLANGVSPIPPKEDNDKPNIGASSIAFQSQENRTANQIQPTSHENNPVLPVAAQLNDCTPPHITTLDKVNNSTEQWSPMSCHKKLWDSDTQQTSQKIVDDARNSDQFWADQFRNKMSSTGKLDGSNSKQCSSSSASHDAPIKGETLTKNYSVLSFESNNSFTKFSPYERSLDYESDIFELSPHSFNSLNTASPLSLNELPFRTYTSSCNLPTSLTNHHTNPHKSHEHSTKIHSKPISHYHFNPGKVSASQNSPLANLFSTHNVNSNMESKHRKQDSEKKALVSKSDSGNDKHVTHSPRDDLSNRTVVMYSPTTSPSKKSPIRYIAAKEQTLKNHITKSDCTNGFDLEDSDSGESVDLAKTFNSVDAKNSKSKKESHSPPRHTPQIQCHSPTKKPLDRLGHHSSDKNRLLNMHWTDNLQSTTCDI
ncbi:atrial natriuretic peptide receptor 1-like isoform X2 [Biomphalaria glabrata]|uniref:Guanylate cyclase n=1 Tax=Biomphalaria glabrata TaxID=6526 RepID=A0A9W3BKC1_BIOGL|nr:atrial natriuretic peptide receptor 1-like isoform X2 [Biomphalaria glabrata]